MLYLCIEHLYDCEEMLDKDLWVFHDRKIDDIKQFEGALREVQTVLEYWKRPFGNRMRLVMRNENPYYGNSYNVLNAYAEAYKTDAKYVYLVEEDVLVTPDFFRWHDAVQEYNPFCSIAGHTYRNKKTFSGDVQGAYFESEEYASLGVCWKRENLDYVVRHATKPYFHNATPYILKHFPGSKYCFAMMEQDGLIQRVMEQLFRPAAWSARPRAFHVGMWGYHRSIGSKAMIEAGVANLPLMEKIENLRQHISDQGWINSVAGFQSDVVAYPKEIPEWSEVYCLI